MDTPGILWPKFEDQNVGMKLAFIGSMNDEILHMDELSSNLIRFLSEHYQGVLKERYLIEETGEAYEMLERICIGRRCFKKGEIPDLEKAAAIVMEDFRSGKLGKITLEFPEGMKEQNE